MVYWQDRNRSERILYVTSRRKTYTVHTIAINTIVANRKGEVSSCDIPFNKDLSLFNEDYLRLTKQVADSCTNHDLTDSMVICTSALVQYEIDGAVGIYSGIFNNPFLIWGKYKHRLMKMILTVSFQFHHTQMDGAHASRFLNNIQKEIDNLRVYLYYDWRGGIIPSHKTLLQN